MKSHTLKQMLNVLNDRLAPWLTRNPELHPAPIKIITQNSTKQPLNR